MVKESITLESNGERYGFNDFSIEGKITRSQVLQGYNALESICRKCPMIPDCLPGAGSVGNINGLESLIFRGKCAGIDSICAIPKSPEGSLIIDISGIDSSEKQTPSLISLWID